MGRNARNWTKLAVLSALEGRGWLRPNVIAELAGYRWKIYALLHRYHRWGLLARNGKKRSRETWYRITFRGRERLAMLRAARDRMRGAHHATPLVILRGQRRNPER